ncbi:MAG: DUF2795 domain-containing protein [Fibrobacter sp.]|nr:DUF2795 domain-containing protein [Fibrobacter sp.]
MGENANPIDVEKFLMNTHFPATKNELIQFAHEKHASNQIISAIETIPNRKYTDAADAARETFIPPDELPRGLDSCDD